MLQASMAASLNWYPLMCLVPSAEDRAAGCNRQITRLDAAPEKATGLRGR